MDRTEQNGTPELTPRQRRAIAVLVGCPTLEEAAKRARIGRSTLYTWLKEKAFADAVEEARREQSREALNFLRSCLLRAVQKLDTLLSSNNETIAYRAAVALLDHGLKAVELEDLAQRIERLEALTNESQGKTAKAGAQVSPTNGHGAF